MTCSKPAAWAVTQAETTLYACQTHVAAARDRLAPTLAVVLAAGRPLIVEASPGKTCDVHRR